MAKTKTKEEKIKMKCALCGAKYDTAVERRRHAAEHPGKAVSWEVIE